jgi:hypothetical protein
VHEVAGPGISVPTRRALSSAALGRARRLDGVDVVVVRARMVGRLREHALERRDDLLGARVRVSVERPQVPGRSTISASA